MIASTEACPPTGQPCRKRTRLPPRPALVLLGDRGIAQYSKDAEAFLVRECRLLPDRTMWWDLK